MQVADFLTPVATVPTISLPALLAHDGAENAALRALLARPGSGEELRGRRIAVLVADGVEEVEVLVPLRVLRARGAKVDVVAPALGPELAKLGLASPPQRRTHVLTVRFMENAGWLAFDRTMDAASAGEYDAVYVPGGAWSPDLLRVDRAALEFLRAAAAGGKPIASICHGPLVLADAGLLKGRRATAYWSIQKDLANAGAQWLDEPVVRDAKVITSRYPLDLPAFLEAFTEELLAR